MSVELIVGLDFMVEGFTWETVITESCACFLPDRLFLSALSELSGATIVKLCVSKLLSRGIATEKLWTTVNLARLDHWDFIDL